MTSALEIAIRDKDNTIATLRAQLAEAQAERDKHKSAFDVLREDHNQLCEGLNSALDAHGIKWQDSSTYAGFMESALARADAAESKLTKAREALEWVKNNAYYPHASFYATAAQALKEIQ